METSTEQRAPSAGPLLLCLPVVRFVYLPFNFNKYYHACSDQWNGPYRAIAGPEAD